MSDTNSLKRTLRREYSHKLNLLSFIEKEQESDLLSHKLESLEVFKRAKVILFYYSTINEPNTHLLLEKWYNKKKILLPVIEESLKIKEFKGNNNLKLGPYNILEPIGSYFTEYEKIDLAIIPGLCFDQSGHRLGKGKGYYDKLLQHMQSYNIGYCFSCQIAALCPTDKFDVKMDMII